MSKDYNSEKYREDNFNYESARADLFDAGVDPDYLSYRNREERDKFMRKNGLDPHRYGSRYTGQSKTSAPERSSRSSRTYVSNTGSNPSGGSIPCHPPIHTPGHINASK